MNVLVIGSGGREHALAWKLSQSPLMKQLYCAPGNAGTSQVGTNAALKVSNHDAVIAFCREHGIDLVMVGPEQPLVEGLADSLRAANIPVVGPSAEAAQLEGSKAFTKDILHTGGIPTAGYVTCTDADSARKAAAQFGFPVVIKADGLAAGKGVIICETKAMFDEALDAMFVEKAFGASGTTVVVEEFLRGEEASYIVLMDGDVVVPLASSQDHKPAYDGDQGPNTGGMGAYSPAPIVTPELEATIKTDILDPLVAEFNRRELHFSGVLYLGLMVTEKGPQVLEFNVRFGDPETQPLMYRMDSDLLDAFNKLATGKLSEVQLQWDPRPAVCVVMASGGYPGPYKKHQTIEGLDAAATLDDSMVFHAGTTAEKDLILATGGRVLGVTAKGDTLGQAIDRAYAAVDAIRWPEVHYRTDIGHKGIRRLRGE